MGTTNFASAEKKSGLRKPLSWMHKHARSQRRKTTMVDCFRPGADGQIERYFCLDPTPASVELFHPRLHTDA